MKRSPAAFVVIALWGLFWAWGDAKTLDSGNLRVELPNKDGSVRFAVFGDMGTGGQRQLQLAEVMTRSHQIFPFEFVLMTGDNIYGDEDPKDYAKKFEQPYRDLLAAGVKFYASLGNHDNPNQRFYKLFNMDGRDYYTFKKGNVRFFALNSNYMDARHVEWLEKELSSSKDEWKVCFFHHPPYSSGERHGSDDELRKVIEPLFLKHGVDVVFNGHEHFYERLKPQKGIHYFISGAGGKLREGNVKPSALTAKSFDRDLHFMLVEVAGDQMHFQAISRTGATVDVGVIARAQAAREATSAK
jgi:predicted phosphodiesterase